MLPVMIAAMTLLMLIGIPVAVAIGLASLIGIGGFTTLPLVVLPQQAYVALDKFPLAAIPFFILAGNLMTAGGISRRLVELVESCVYSIRGGILLTCVFTALIFGAVSGSSVATTLAIGAVLIPAMVRRGYPVGFAAALQATAAELSVLIPPSIPMIIYGLAADVSVGDLFLAGTGPGILVAVALSAFALFYSRRKGFVELRDEARPPFLPALKGAGLALMMPVIVLGGIYGGVFTPTEASVIAVGYSLLVSLVYREIDLRGFGDVIKRSAISSAIVMFIVSMAGIFSFALTRAGIPAAIGAWIVESFTSPISFLIAVNVFLFVLGMFIETSAAIVVLGPILAPVAVHYGIDPVHFGIIMIFNLAMGMITPPLGVNLFAACAVANIGIEKMIPYLLPLVGLILICLGFVTFVPAISLFLIG
ncbi:MAG: TRAP transporter large permease [Alphaproteobacteria bacterium]|jgi:C4-dicarboxylate transporter, DctM subunit|nr:TRAP transporter large permease [Alphaproteobacteria bacterium]MBU0804341.1 TRAP transporter large permease [Alphaproteobacteria bacterium]MBU0871172.1 TRAP transporter large permease [Alphaproteobacteria bacterium]MBU1400927.1 TRAP transporter large permease [Alphaproteobacteria bacterium]MBU1592656.1 TRAP transporter large permease [Alphaproteobacteria bacterium]